MPHHHDVRGIGFKKLTNVDRALRVFLNSFKPIGEKETVSLSDAFGRVCAQNITSPIDLPQFSKSAVDGYAVTTSDTREARKTSAVVLRIVGESRLGSLPNVRVGPGTAARIATGAALPRGSDAVVMIEKTKKTSRGVAVYEPVQRRDEVVHKGEDVKKGSRLLGRGDRIRAQDVALLSAVGIGAVKVYRRPVIGVLSTGNELIDAGGRARPGRIFDANRPALLCWIRQAGAIPYDLGICKDDESALRRKLRNAINNLDGVVVTAGSSVGPADLIPTVIDSMGKPGMLVHGVAMRPAMPTGLAVLHGKPVASLPGFPVSAMVSFVVFMQPAIRRLMNAPPDPHTTLKARLASAVRGVQGMRSYVRVKLRKGPRGFRAEPLKYPAGSLLSSITRAHGFIVVPEESAGFRKGDEVSVELLRPV